MRRRWHLETLTQMIGIIVLDWVESHLAHSANLLHLLLIHVHGLVVAVAGLVHLVFGVLVWRDNEWAAGNSGDVLTTFLKVEHCCGVLILLGSRLIFEQLFEDLRLIRLSVRIASSILVASRPITNFL